MINNERLVSPHYQETSLFDSPFYTRLPHLVIDTLAGQTPAPELTAAPTSEPQKIQDIYLEIEQGPQGVNGANNPLLAEVGLHPLTVDSLLDSVAHKLPKTEGENPALWQAFREDAAQLVENVTAFESDFLSEFQNSALFDESKSCDLELVLKLRNFLMERIPNWFPRWDCNPSTQYTLEEQIHNFRERTRKHVDLDMLYIQEYAVAWNKTVDSQPISEERKAKLRLDQYFLMCRALLHDLGRWFTQDSRAHEEIPALIALRTKLLAKFLTLESNPAEHPREFDVNQPLTQKYLIRILEFFSDFYSKPHNDFIWDEAKALLHKIKELDALPAEERELSENQLYRLKLQEEFKQLEKDRQSELRHIHLAYLYFLYSGLGYSKITVEDIHNWHQLIHEKYADSNPDKLKYLETEARMLEQGRIFLLALGISPVSVREKVQEIWNTVADDDSNLEQIVRMLKTVRL